MTPYELSLYISVYNERSKDEQEERVTIAYLTALWGRVKKMPSLKELFEKATPKKPLTDEEMLARVQQLNALFGGDVMREGGE